MSTATKQATPFQFKKAKTGFQSLPALNCINTVAYTEIKFPVIQKSNTVKWQKNTGISQLPNFPAAQGVKVPSIETMLNQAVKESASFSNNLESSLPFLATPPPSGSVAPNNIVFLAQLDETLRTINRNNRPSAKRKSMLMMVIGLMLSGGLVAGAMNTSIDENTQSFHLNFKKNKASQANNALFTEPVANAKTTNTDIFDEVQPSTIKASQPNTEAVAFATVATTTLASPPISAVDDSLIFDKKPTALKQALQPTQKGIKSAHVIDLFEDSAPVPSLLLPEQKKRETLDEALASPPSVPNYQQPNGSDNKAKPWWHPEVKSVFNFKRPLMHLKISSHFGHRWGRMHRGVDFSAPYGVAIYAANAGRVVYSGWEHGYGKLVIVDHGNGVRTKYAHCSKLNVSVGDWVTKGERIAKVGSTGHSTGPHLHFEVVVNGKTKNPLAYLNA